MDNFDKKNTQGMNKDMDNQEIQNDKKFAGQNANTDQSYVHDTAGGEMPEPGKDPSKTDFKVDKEK